MKIVSLKSISTQDKRKLYLNRIGDSVLLVLHGAGEGGARLIEVSFQDLTSAIEDLKKKD